MIKTVSYDNSVVTILDQSKLPSDLEYIHCSKPEEVADAIVKLKVRGAPLIGVTAAYGIALGIINYQDTKDNISNFFIDLCNLMASTRPTAINLFWAIDKMKKVFEENFFLEKEYLGEVLLEEANNMYLADIDTNQKIGHYGETLLNPDANVMTICNAGALATCGYGTALGIIRSAFTNNKINMVWACETRPVLQGARLTVWELVEDNIPVTLITDNMAAYIMSLGKVDAVIVGADRIALNGDTANKIGTYSLALAAHYHSIPFYVAAPTSTFDLTITSGESIPIEERDPKEVKQIGDNFLTHPNATVFNPAFDVTPNHLITALICEKGIIKPSFDKELIKMIGKEAL